MPNDEYDPNKNWVWESYVGSQTGQGRGVAGMVANQEYEAKKKREAETRKAFVIQTQSTPRGDRSTAKPIFPFVDLWLSKVPSWSYYVLGGAGAAVGYGLIAREGGEHAWVGALLGFVAGLLILPLATVVIKLSLVALIVAVGAGLVYGLYQAMLLFGWISG